jgi:hypothetical protein
MIKEPSNNHRLFRIIGRISEDARIETSLDTITACNNNAVSVCLNELII